MAWMKGSVSWAEVRAELPLEMQDSLNETRALRIACDAIAEMRAAAGLPPVDFGLDGPLDENGVPMEREGRDILLTSVARHMRVVGGVAELVLRGPDGKEVRIELDDEPALIEKSREITDAAE